MDIPSTMRKPTRRACPPERSRRRMAILLCVTTVLASPATAQVDQQRAQEFFKDVR